MPRVTRLRRTRRISLVAIFVLAAVQVGLAESKPCTSVTLTFSARKGTWTTTGNAAGCTGPRTELDVNGIYTVYVASTLPLKVVISDINPLLYRASFGEVTLTDIPQLKDIAALFLQFGGVVKDLSRQVGAMLDKKDAPPPLSDLQNALRVIQEDLEGATGFEAQQWALISATQQLEFGEVVGPKITTDLEQWTAHIAALRLAYEAALAYKRAGTEPRIPDDILQQAARILEKQGDVLKAMAAARLVAERFAPGTRIARQIVLEPLRRTSDWDKIATYPVAISRDSPYDDAVVTALPKAISTKFRLASPQASRFGVTIDLTTSYAGRSGTPLVSPKFSAVAPASKPDEKLVTKTGEEGRVAIKTLMATYDLSATGANRPVRPVFEFGASIESDAPGAFIGVGTVLWKYLHLGVGFTGQPVRVLDGQSTTTVVTGDAGVKTKDKWTYGWYWSLGLSLTSLPLFSRD